MSTTTAAEQKAIIERRLARKRQTTEQWHMTNPGYHKERIKAQKRAEEQDGIKTKHIQKWLCIPAPGIRKPIEQI